MKVKQCRAMILKIQISFQRSRMEMMFLKDFDETTIFEIDMKRYFNRFIVKVESITMYSDALL